MIHQHNEPHQSNARGIYYLRVYDSYYIGKTARSFATRFSEHIEDLTQGKHANYKLQDAFSAGLPIACGILLTLETEDLIDRAEIALIRYYENRVKLLNIDGVSHAKQEHVRNNSVSASERQSVNISQLVNGPITPKNSDITLQEMAKQIALGKRKKDIIKDLFGVQPGASKKYKIASAIYDKMIAQGKIT